MKITTKAKNVLSLIDDLDFEEKHITLRADNVIVEEPEPLIKMYPNPIAGVLNLEYNGTITEALNVSIYNLMSNDLVYEGEMTSNTFVLDVSDWDFGFYSIVVKDIEGNLIYKSSTKIKN